MRRRSRKTENSKELRFRLYAGDRSDYRLVTVDVAKVNSAWQYPDSGYIDADGSGAIAGRIKLFERWLSEHRRESILAPTVYLSDSRDRVHFHDGRHRFAVLRDHGHRVIKVGVLRSQVSRFRRQFAPKTGEHLAAIKHEEGKLERQVGRSQRQLDGLRDAALGESAMNGAGRVQKPILSAEARAKISKAAKRRRATVKTGVRKATS